MPPANTDSFAVAVNNGYGSGKYKVGDTVHVFCNNYSSNQLFDVWSGDISLLTAPQEWHTWFIMPQKNVSLTAGFKTSSSFTLQYEQIMGRDRLKPVYYYFPAGHKGFVYLLHGTGGSAANLVSDYEWQILIRDLVSNNFGVIVTEAEESTVGHDINGDGAIRWFLTPVTDTVNNVDFANIRIITDTFYNRNVTNRSTLRYSIGMSDGGFFSSSLSYVYHYTTSINYCSQGAASIMQKTTVPTQFCMASNDTQPGVGQQGNADALTYSNAFLQRGICSKYFIQQRSPVYQERFSRRGDISVSQSVSVYNELKANGYIDGKNYFIGLISDALQSDYQTHASKFPVINSLSLSQQSFVLEQLNIAAAAHHMYCDFNRATLKFLNTQCL
ncbi:MAG: hypothetical protein JSS64_10165 [Bacteroidetes bacterium]|nr:hypothetical protein [Bacteroidota bacterium]